MKTLNPTEVAVREIFGTITEAIVPRPIAFVSTLDENGNANLAPFSFFNGFGANPATLIFSPARRGRDNTTKHTYDNIKLMPECVINMVNYSIVHQMNIAGADFPKGVDEFVKSGLTKLPSEAVKPFRVKESPVQMECIVKQVIETGIGGGSGNLVICEVVRIHISDDILTNGKIDIEKLQPVGRMGGDNYVKAFGNSLFSIHKFEGETCLGFDNLPQHIRNSKFLSGNDLGKLAALQTLPTQAEIDGMNQHIVLREFKRQFGGTADIYNQQVQLFAKELLIENRTRDAFAALMNLY